MTGRPTPKELSRSYRSHGSVPAVAKEFGVAYETARRWLMTAGVDLRAKGRPSKRAERLDARMVIAHYEAGESIATIGESFGVSPATIRSRLRAAGVELRPRRGWKY